MAANVSADSFIPQIWDASVLRTLEDNLVAKKICNLKPTQQIKAAGDTIYFNGLADPTVDNYTGSLTYENLVSGQIALLIDKQKSYAFKVGDIEQSMANVDLKGSQAARAAYMLKDACDADILQGVTSQAAATAVSDDNCDSATIIGDMAEAARSLMEQNVSQDNMWMVIPPWVMLKLKLAGVAFSINEGINGKGGMQWTKDLGFDVYVTNNVYNSAVTPVSVCLAGSYQAIGFAEKLMKSRAMELEDSFDVGLSGLLVYGYKVIKPKELCTITLTYTAETAI